MVVSVDIILPCFNPNENWHLELLNFHNAIKKFYDVNFIVVNDGSVFGNVEGQIKTIKENNVKINYISYENNMGKGYALRQGVKLAGSLYLIYTDIDFPFTNVSTLNLINCLVKEDNDLVVGYRDETYYQKKMSGFRKILSKSFRILTRNILKMPVSDTQCGLKGFNQKGKEEFLKTTINRYLFDFEFIYLSNRNKKLKIMPIPVELKDNIVFSKMRFKIIIQEFLNLLYILILKKN